MGVEGDWLLLLLFGRARVDDEDEAVVLVELIGNLVTAIDQLVDRVVLLTIDFQEILPVEFRLKLMNLVGRGSVEDQNTGFPAC